MVGEVALLERSVAFQTLKRGESPVLIQGTAEHLSVHSVYNVLWLHGRPIQLLRNEL